MPQGEARPAEAPRVIPPPPRPAVTGDKHQMSASPEPPLPPSRRTSHTVAHPDTTGTAGTRHAQPDAADSSERSPLLGHSRARQDSAGARRTNSLPHVAKEGSRFAFYNVRNECPPRGMLRAPIVGGSTSSAPPGHPPVPVPRNPSDASIWRSSVDNISGAGGTNNSHIETLRVDLRKVAYKLRISLEHLLRHLQDTRELVTHRPEGTEKGHLVLEVPVGGGDDFQDPIAGTPLPSPTRSPCDSPIARKGSHRKLEREVYGTAVVVAHRNCESPALMSATDEASLSASMCSDDTLTVEVRDGELPHVAYLIQDNLRGSTVLAIPHLIPIKGAPKRDADETEAASSRAPGRSCCLVQFFCPPSPFGPSTSDPGGETCLETCTACLSHTSVVRSVVLYTDGPSLFVQVQRHMPIWGIPCLLTGMVCSAFIPILFRKLRDETFEEDGTTKTIGTDTAHVWWAVCELLLATLLLVGQTLKKPRSIRPLADGLCSFPTMWLIAATLVTDTTRHISWSFLLDNPEAEGPTQILHASHPLLLLLIRLAACQLLMLGEAAGVALSMVGMVVAMHPLGSFTDWHPAHGALAGGLSGLSIAGYLSAAGWVVSNLPVVGLVWLCKIFNVIGAVAVVYVKGHHLDGLSAFAPSTAIALLVTISVVGVLRDIIYLLALDALHSLAVSTTMTIDAVLAILVSHFLFHGDEKLGSSIEPSWMIPGIVSCAVGIIVTCYVSLKERQYAEVDLASAELTRKTARPPPKLTAAALRHQQRVVKNEPPIMWEYCQPPAIRTSQAASPCSAPVPAVDRHSPVAQPHHQLTPPVHGTLPQPKIPARP